MRLPALRRTDLINDMKISIKALILISFAILLSSCTSTGPLRFDRTPAGVAAHSEQAPRQLALLQGVTSPTETQISVVFNRTQRLRALLWDGDRLVEEVTNLSSMNYPGSEWVAGKLKFKNLKPNVTYRLEIFDEAGGHEELIDVRNFQTLSPSKDQARLTLVSCMNHRPNFEPVFPLGKKMGAEQSDLQLFLGDNVYTDFDGAPTALGIWEKYAESRRLLPIFKAADLTPTIAVWDDHDYGKNNAGETYELKEQAKNAFDAFYAQDEIPGVYERGPGVSSQLNAFGQRFLIMDTRYFRTEAGDDDPKGTPWGGEQETWFADRMAEPGGPLWIVNGVQFFGGYHNGESIERNFPGFFVDLVEQLKKTNSLVVLVTGDIHMSEVSDLKKDLGYPTYELTSSALHSYNLYNNGPPLDNPRRVISLKNKRPYVTEPNYMTVDFRADQKGLLLNVKVKTQSPGVQWTRRLRAQRR